MGIRVCYYSYPYRDKVAGSVRIGKALGPRHGLVERPEPGAHYEVHAQFSRIRRVSLVDPWPAFEIEWKDHRKASGSEILTRRFHPHRLHRLFSLQGALARSEQFAAIAGELVERISEDLGDDHVDRGWLDEPDIDWEPADQWPLDVNSTDGPAYRTATERVVASRPRCSPTDAMLIWLASSPDKPWRRTPREIALTERRVYCRSWDSKVFSLPRESLRLFMEVGDYGDKVFIFGRRTPLVLPHRADCAVEAALTSATTRAPSPGK